MESKVFCYARNFQISQKLVLYNNNYHISVHDMTLYSHQLLSQKYFVKNYYTCYRVSVLVPDRSILAKPNFRSQITPQTATMFFGYRVTDFKSVTVSVFLVT